MPTGLGDEQLWLCPSLDNVTPFNDQSGQGNNGTAQGGLSTVADTGSGGAYCYDFDGVDDYISCSTIGSGTTDAFSSSLWVNLDVWGNAKYLFSCNGDGSSEGTNSFDGYIKQTNILYSFTRPNPTVLEYTYSGGAGHWFHLCFNREAGTGAIDYYINGVKVASATGNSDLASFANGCAVGGYSNGLPRYLIDGKLDDFRLYKRALTQSEITHLATARGIEGRPFDGLGDEQLWLCPSLENSPNDLSGNNNNGVYQGGMGTVADASEGGSLAYDFDGSDDYIDCGNVLNITGPLSISFWVLNDTASKAMYVSKTWDGLTEGYISRLDSWASILQYYTYRYSLYGTSIANPFTLSQWSCVTNVYNGTHWEIYIDGAMVAQTADTQAPFSNAGNLLFGNTTAAGGWNLDGRMDDIRIYDRALTQSEISWLATERGVLGTPPEGLGDEQLWLCPSIQDGANDLSGNGNDGVIGSSVTTVADTSNGGTLAYNFPDTAGTNTITINDFDLGGLSQLTWSAWIYDESDNAASTHSSFFSWRRTGGSGNDDILFFNYERSKLGFQLNNGADGGAFYTPVYYQNWKHYCVVFDGTNPTAADRLNLYVNGVAQTPDTTFSYPATTASPSGTSYAEIGDYVGSANHGLFNFKGKQDDIRIYDRAITQAEITHLATSRGVLGSPATTTQYNAFVTHAFRQLFQTRLR
jgi:hypothetical protein